MAPPAAHPGGPAQDAANPRGVWRRTTESEYARPAPAWEAVIDVDRLGAAEGVSWVWQGVRLLDPGPAPGAAPTRALVRLSRGGADAVVVREFDLAAGRFVPAGEGGFEVAEAKTSAEFLGPDTLLVGTHTGPGSLTDSGYPRQARPRPRAQQTRPARADQTRPAFGDGSRAQGPQPRAYALRRPRCVRRRPHSPDRAAPHSRAVACGHVRGRGAGAGVAARHGAGGRPGGV